MITIVLAAVGSLVVQLAKADGLKVIASAGSDEKVEFVKQLGADIVFNYKKEDVADVLKREGPLDMYVPLSFIFGSPNKACSPISYWDNVGGYQLDSALANATERGARFIVRTICPLTVHDL